MLAGRTPRSNLAVHLFQVITDKRRGSPSLMAELPGDSPAQVQVAALTRRESEVIRCLASGMSNAQIADSLGVSSTTVRNHIEHLLAKLGVHSRLEAVVTAARRRMI